MKENVNEVVAEHCDGCNRLHEERDINDVMDEECRIMGYDNPAKNNPNVRWIEVDLTEENKILDKMYEEAFKKYRQEKEKKLSIWNRFLRWMNGK